MKNAISLLSRILACRPSSGLLAGTVLVLAAMVSMQLGASEAKFLLAAVGPEAGAFLRLAAASLVLFAALRPWRTPPRGSQWKSVLAYGLAVGAMNACFYQAIAIMPLGIVVAIEFAGPLCVAACTSRRLLDFASILLAAAGILLLLPFTQTARVSWEGVLWACAAGIFWALYIVFGRRAGKVGTSSAVAWGLLAATLIVLPSSLSGLAGHADILCTPSVLALALFVGIASSALPFWLEMRAMGVLPANVYGVFMSLEPALAALFGMLVVDEWLNLRQWTAIGVIVLSSVLIVIRKDEPRRPDGPPSKHPEENSGKMRTPRQENPSAS